MVKVEKGEYLGVDTVEISNEKFKLIVTTGVGARIISYSLINGQNMLNVNKMQFMNRADMYKTYGGHRLSYLPEHEERSFIPDNRPCEVQMLSEGVVVSAVEPLTNIKKSMQIEMKDNGKVRIIHTVKNQSLFDIDIAISATTEMSQGGKAVIPQCNKQEGALPNRSIVAWDYTNLADSRLKFNISSIEEVEQRQCETPFKIGTFDNLGYMTYTNYNSMFVKQFDVMEGEFADRGCNAEVFTDDNMLSLISLSPMTKLAVGAEVSHTEVWQLFSSTQGPLKEQSQKAEIELKEYAHA